MIPCAGTMRDRARAHCTISVFNAHIVIKGPRYQMRGGPPVIRASDRPIIPSALLTKNIMPISGDLFRACAEPCSLCPCPTPYFLFSSYLDSPPSSLSLSFHLGETYHVRSLPPSSRLVSSFHSATLCLSPIFTVDAWHRVLPEHACYLSNGIIPSMLICGDLSSLFLDRSIQSYNILGLFLCMENGKYEHFLMFRETMNIL